MSSVKETESNLQLKLQSAYPWIDDSLFEKALRIDFPSEKIFIKNYVLHAALNKGENYGSLMIRANVHYTLDEENKEINFIIKAAPCTESLDEKMIDETKVLFNVEIDVYDKVLTKVQKLLNEIGDKTQLYGRCYVTNKEQSYLIFEDLSVEGFKNVDRRTGLDVAHYKVALITLAKYHAATAVLIEREPSLQTSFNQPSTVTGANFLKKMLTNFLLAEIEFCKIQPGLEKLVDKLSKIKENFYEKICSSYVRDENEFNVITHGDLWCNNIMFKYDANGDVKETVLVDFQISYYGSPVLDVAYLLYTSSDTDVSESDWELLIQFYYDELKATLLKFNYTKNVPTLMQFHTQIIMRGLFGAFVGIMTEAVRMVEDFSDDGLDIFVKDDAAEYRLNAVLNPKVLPQIIKRLKFFDRRGYFESD